ncbi:MAG: HEAT repeat domain-containing protein [Candidatus Auribacterota bacterium]|nr:HEAT repeat domain-containing protein [Candidatus Auribacterota bacterium]
MKSRISLIFTFSLIMSGLSQNCGAYPKEGYNILEKIFFVPAAAIQFVAVDIPSGIASMFNPVPAKIKKNKNALRQNDWIKRYEAVKNLAAIKHEDAYTLLAESLTDNHTAVSIRAYEELTRVTDEKLTPILIKNLESHDPWTRKLTLDLLASSENPDIVKNLVFLANDESREVKLSALLALEDISKESLIFRYFPVGASNEPADNIVNWWYTRGKILKDIKTGTAQ